MSRCLWASLSSRSVTQSAGVIPYNGSNTSSSAQVNFARPRETTCISTSHYTGTQKRPLPLYPHDAQRMKHMLRRVVVFTYCVVICCITLLPMISLRLDADPAVLLAISMFAAPLLRSQSSKQHKRTRIHLRMAPVSVSDQFTPRLVSTCMACSAYIHARPVWH